MMTWCEVGGALCHKAALYTGDGSRSREFMNAAARLFARDAVERVYLNGLKIIYGCNQTIDEAGEALSALNMALAMNGKLNDMNLVSSELVK